MKGIKEREKIKGKKKLNQRGNLKWEIGKKRDKK
jgi:hypothetical protein